MSLWGKALLKVDGRKAMLLLWSASFFLRARLWWELTQVGGGGGVCILFSLFICLSGIAVSQTELEHTHSAHLLGSPQFCPGKAGP